MPGTWTRLRRENVSIHTFAAPEEGWEVNSHLLEFTTEIFAIDAQYTIPLAEEVAKFAETLGKPLTRLYVTHYHPDHLMGASAFRAPLFALSSVAEKIAAVGDRVAREEHEKMGEKIPEKARQVERFIEEGEESVDGVRIALRRLRSAETQDALVISIPDAGAIIVQDLIYHRIHPFLGERNFESWKADLREYWQLPYDLILPGHGASGGVELYDQMLSYLEVAEAAYQTSPDATEFRRQLVESFPDHGGLKVLDHQMRFLFPKKRQSDA
jgi:glyoxylase-like metal-dependent hydrolase (beta-lactamase superfamily II)